MKKILSLFLILTMLSTPAYSRYIPHGSVHNNNNNVPSETHNSKGLFERLKGKSVDGFEIIDVIYNYDYQMYADIICVKNAELNYIRIKLFHLMKENMGLFENHFDYSKEIKQLLGEN